jgi:hypothetical protein
MTRESVFGRVGSIFVLVLCGLWTACGGSSTPGTAIVAIAKTQNPLVAQYSLSTNCAGQAMVEFGPNTSYGRSTALYGMVAGSTTNILVAGMRASTTYHMRATYSCNGSTYTSQDQTFTTGPLPSSRFPSLVVNHPNPSLSSLENPGIELLDTLDAGPNSGIMKAVITDRDAHPIWYYDTGVAQGLWAFDYKLLPNGHLIFNIAKALQPGTILREVDLAGNTIREMSNPVLAQKMHNVGFHFTFTQYHHDILPLDNGHLIVLGNYTVPYTNLPDYQGVTNVLGDAIVDLDPNWNPVWAWTTFDHLDVRRHLNGLPDWTHSNAVVYSPNDGNLLLSMRNQSWILKIDYENGTGSGNILWKLGYKGDFTLTPTNQPIDWFSFQHYPWIIGQNGPQTTLAIWDNGDSRVLNTQGQTCGFPPHPSCYSRATIFGVNESTMVSNLNWFYLPQVPLLGDAYSFFGGSIHQLENNNVEFDVNAPLGSSTLGAQIQEVTQTANPQVVWEMSIGLPLYAYRAYRIPSLYPGVSWQY